MGQCDRVGCDGDDRIGYTCRHCDRRFCSAHRLPEQHNCHGLRVGSSKAIGPWFKPGLSSHRRTTDAGVIQGDDRGRSIRDRIESFTPDWVLPGTRPPKDDLIDNPSPETAPDGSLVYPDDSDPRARSSSPISSGRRTLGMASRAIGSLVVWPVVVLVLAVELVVAYRLPLVAVSLVLAAGIGFGFVSSTAVLPADFGTRIDDGLRSLVDDASGLVANATADGNASAGSSARPTDAEDTREPIPTTDPTQTVANDEPGTVTGIDAEELETLVHERVNDRRRDHGLSVLDADAGLEEIAEYHSVDMAHTGYFSHDSPSGETMGDRYDRFGYDCRVPVGGNRYATGAENIFMSTSRGLRLEEATLADRVVAGWMNSPGHRENLLRSYWRREGIGVAAVEVGGESRVYVTQNFC